MIYCIGNTPNLSFIRSLLPGTGCEVVSAINEDDYLSGFLLGAESVLTMNDDILNTLFDVKVVDEWKKKLVSDRSKMGFKRGFKLVFNAMVFENLEEDIPAEAYAEIELEILKGLPSRINSSHPSSLRTLAIAGYARVNFKDALELALAVEKMKSAFQFKEIV